MIYNRSAPYTMSSNQAYPLYVLAGMLNYNSSDDVPEILVIIQNQGGYPMYLTKAGTGAYDSGIQIDPGTTFQVRIPAGDDAELSSITGGNVRVMAIVG